MKQKDDGNRNSASPWTDTMHAASGAEVQEQPRETQLGNRDKRGNRTAVNTNDGVTKVLFEVYNG